MADNPNEITIDNSVLVLIDHQPWVAFAVNSIDAGLLVNNLAGLASSAKALDVPIILTTVGADGGALKDPVITGLAGVIPDVTPIDRVSTNAWEDIRQTVEATGSVLAGLCSGLSRMKGNFHVRFLGEGAAAMPLSYPTPNKMNPRHSSLLFCLSLR